jgi:hypothetical protein
MRLERGRWEMGDADSVSEEEEEEEEEEDCKGSYRRRSHPTPVTNRLSNGDVRRTRLDIFDRRR